MNRSSTSPARRLFLDDDPSRASRFLRRYPDAVWVQTVEECLACLEEPWDEVHLDHDLGGEQNVDFERGDCGMAVVRWIVREPRPHLTNARFFVHTHNTNAACLMALHLQQSGYPADVRPFDSAFPPGAGRRRSTSAQTNPRASLARRIERGLRAVLFGS
jgi:hypothetical protein